jgi:hypothetical protein
MVGRRHAFLHFPAQRTVIQVTESEHRIDIRMAEKHRRIPRIIVRFRYVLQSRIGLRAKPQPGYGMKHASSRHVVVRYRAPDRLLQQQPAAGGKSFILSVNAGLRREDSFSIVVHGFRSSLLCIGME